MYSNWLNFYTSIKKHQKLKSRNKSHLQLHQKNPIRYLGINLTKEVKVLYYENYRKLIKKVKKTQRNGKTFHAHGLMELILVKYLCYPKQSTHSMQSLEFAFWEIFLFDDSFYYKLLVCSNVLYFSWFSLEDYMFLIMYKFIP